MDDGNDDDEEEGEVEDDYDDDGGDPYQLIKINQAINWVLVMKMTCWSIFTNFSLTWPLTDDEIINIDFDQIWV